MLTQTKIIFRVHQLFKDKKLKELQLSKISKCLMELVGHENDITLSLGKYKVCVEVRQLFRHVTVILAFDKSIVDAY